MEDSFVQGEARQGARAPFRGGSDRHFNPIHQKAWLVPRAGHFGGRAVDKLVVGCGYLGRRVAALWRAAGHRVFATTRGERRADELRGLGVEPVVCDVLDTARLALPAADGVAYCVGFDRTAGATMRAVYVGGLANVLA